MSAAVPSQQRYFFAGGDHWIVRQGDDGATVILEQKRYRWWQFFTPCFVLPVIIALLGGIHFVTVGNLQAFLLAVFFAIVIACLLIAFYRIEWTRLQQQPKQVFVWQSDQDTEIMGKRYKAISCADMTFEYTFFQHGTLPGKGSFSELKVAVGDGSARKEILLLSQKSNWALKHARKLNQLTKIPLKRMVVAR